MRGNSILLSILAALIALLSVGWGGKATNAKSDEESVNKLLANRTGQQEEITNSIGMRFRLIPAGSFMMGALPGDGDAGDNEAPQHQVEITKPFYLGVYEVTQAQYLAVMGENPSYIEGDNYPVEIVSWAQAQEFCARLSQKEGVTYRLPTEAEWEYACRAGTNTKFYWGRVLDGRFAWYADNSLGGNQDVGTRKPNPWGLYDMNGNICEWCSDWYDQAYYSVGPASDPHGPQSGESRVVRGGSRLEEATSLRSSFRNKFAPDNGGMGIGFRVVREVE
jgi:formylglycine-generating enzyme required for sulfatase activity